MLEPVSFVAATCCSAGCGTEFELRVAMMKPNAMTLSETDAMNALLMVFLWFPYTKGNAI
tara:strand:- start:1493 stop:1672 length:180 start_codon:yes stop_codon:yes gene_type:complete